MLRACPRCSGGVEAVDLVTECPHCGYEIRNPRPAPFSETLILDDEPTLGAPPSAVTLANTAEPAPQPTNLPDPLLGSDFHVYQVESVLGQGGMGRVYLARHRDLHRRCALKILLPELVERQRNYIERFMNEGRAAAALSHPNIITVHAVGQERDTYFLEMEFVPGRSLGRVLHDEQRLNPLKATLIAARIADGLAEAHRLGIVHRDLKPDNVLLTLQGVPKIADFGLAKVVRAGLTNAAGEPLCGTPHFMAPELYNGAPASPTTDVYALGVTYFLMLAGRVPFGGRTLTAVMGEVLNTPLPNIRRIVPEVSLEMAECLAMLLDRNPANRPADGVRAAQLLQSILGHSRDVDSLLDEAFGDDPNVQVQHEGRRHVLRVRFPNGRHQTVLVEASHHAAADRLLIITSICCPATPEFYDQALRINADMPHGSIAVADVDGTPSFIVHDTYPRATVDAEEVRKSVKEVAARADGIERLLTGGDIR